MSNSEQDIIPTEVNQCFEIGEQLLSKVTSTLDKRIRNLDKRRTKLILLDDECKQGKSLNEDQKCSLAKIPVIDGNIEMAREMVGILKDTSSEYSSHRGKFVTKKPHPKKEERVSKPPLTSNTFSQLIQFHALLVAFTKIDTLEKIANDYAELQISENDLIHLRSFLDLTQMWEYPGLVSLHSDLPAISKHFTLLMDSSKECFQDNLSYYKLQKILFRLCSAQKMKTLDDMMIDAIALAEDLEDYAQQTAALPVLKHKSTTTSDIPIDEPVPIVSQTILNQSAEPLTEVMFMSSTSRLANSVTNSTDNSLIQTTVFVPSERDPDTDCVSKPRIDTPEEAKRTEPPTLFTSAVRVDPTPLSSAVPIEPTQSADPIYPEQICEAVDPEVIEFSGINLSNVPAVSEEDFDFLHDSELPVAPVKHHSQAKPFSTSAQQSIQPISGTNEGANSGYMGARFPESNYKGRAHNPNVYSTRQQATTSNYPDVNLGSDMMRFGQKEQAQHYVRGNQTDIQHPPQQIASSSLAQPFGGMVVENSSGAGRVDNTWNRK